MTFSVTVTAANGCPQAEAQLPGLRDRYAKAKEEDDLETAIQLKKQMDALKQQARRSVIPPEE
jgi:hypothetical protein